MIGPYYKAKLFEYHKTGLYRGLPGDPNQVVTITDGTIKNIRGMGAAKGARPRMIVNPVVSATGVGSLWRRRFLWSNQEDDT